MAVEFTVKIHEFMKAVKFILAGRAPGKKAQVEFVDLNARDGEVELVATGVSVDFPAEVVTSGYGRAPHPVFEWFSRAVKTLHQPTVRVLIEPGKAKAANLTFSHPDISIRPIGARIADLPVNGSLPDVLALLVQFNTEELSESGLLGRVLAGQEQTSALIDQATRILEPLEVDREALSKFVWQQIKQQTKAHE
jgi:hypothetical protein